MIREFDTISLSKHRDRLEHKYKKPKRSPVEDKGQSISDQSRQQQQQDYGGARSTVSQFEGPVDKSPFYKALYNTGVSGTSNAYQSARTNQRSRAKAAGYGYEQPVAQGADAQLDRSEAQDMAQVGPKSLVAATQPALEAAQISSGMGTAEGSQGLGYWQSTIPLEQQYQQQLQQRQQALWNAIAQIPQDLGTAFA